MSALHSLVSSREKPWGFNRHLLSLPGLELHHATIQPGGYSSRHYHAHKDNHFYVVSGQLTVQSFKMYDSNSASRIVTVQAGEQLIVSAGEWHRFINPGPERVELIETYWGSPEHSHEDIVRADEGGRQTVKQRGKDARRRPRKRKRSVKRTKR